MKRQEEARTIAESDGGCVWAKFSDGDWYQFTKEAASKWSAVRAISEQTGIAVCDMAAFGDDRVDMEIAAKTNRIDCCGEQLDSIKYDLYDYSLNVENSLFHRQKRTF